MDKLRPVIAIVLCLVIWGVYFKFFAPDTPKSQPKKPTPTEIGKGPGGTNGNGTIVEKPPVDPAQPPPAAFTHPVVAVDNTVLENEVLRVEITNAGASVRRLILKAYKDPFERDEHGNRKDLAFLDEFQAGFRSLSLRDSAGVLPLDTVNWETLEAPAGEVKYRYTTPDGLRIVKTIGLGPEKHAVKLKLEVENISETPLARGLELIGAAGIVQEASGGIYPSDAAGLWRDGKTYSVDTHSSGSGCCGPSAPLKDLTAKMRETDLAGVSWNAAVNKYFVCAIIPRPEDRASVAKFRSWAIEFKAEAKRKLEHEKISRSDPKAKELLDWTVNTVAISAVLKDRTWQKGEKSSTEWVIFAGPKETDALNEGRFKDWRLGDLLDFGWFGIISKLLLTIMGWMHFVFRNWGLAVIALVLIVRMCIFPISKKAQVSMFRMQKLQPQLKVIQERYKGDPSRVNAETMKFMKEQGVNPIGGCLPLFLQLPIFLGLYNALLSDIHLRQQPFFGWINDLSQPDHLANLPFSVPMHATNAFNLLPLVMMATWFIQAFMAPRSPDPQMAAQQKMFMIMPLVIGWMMYMSPSGLVLYWLVSTAWGIAEQQYIKRTYLK
ncbi:MAG: membrane protein insertase YidC [Planctomycetota bacterium]